MKITAIMGLMAIGAIAAPHELSKRAGITENDIKEGKCEKYTFSKSDPGKKPFETLLTWNVLQSWPEVPLSLATWESAWAHRLVAV